MRFPLVRFLSNISTHAADRLLFQHSVYQHWCPYQKKRSHRLPAQSHLIMILALNRSRCFDHELGNRQQVVTHSPASLTKLEMYPKQTQKNALFGVLGSVAFELPDIKRNECVLGKWIAGICRVFHDSSEHRSGHYRLTNFYRNTCKFQESKKKRTCQKCEKKQGIEN